MVNLTKKYAETIKEMVVDAQANVTEAEGKLKESTENRRECAESIKELKTTAKDAHKAFLEVIKNLGKLAVSKNPSAEDVQEAIKPCEVYAAATAQIPTAEENFKEAEEKWSTAKEELHIASVELKKISFFNS